MKEVIVVLMMKENIWGDVEATYILEQAVQEFYDGPSSDHTMTTIWLGLVFTGHSSFVGPGFSTEERKARRSHGTAP